MTTRSLDRTRARLVSERSGCSISGASLGLSVLWHGHIFDPSGYGEETREFVLGVDAARIPVRAVPLPSNGDFRGALPRRELARLWELIAPSARPPADRLISVFHSMPDYFLRVAGADYHIGRTMFETDRLPEHWVPACNLMDEIWVPSGFNIETFARSGVPRTKLVRMPGAIDVERFSRSARPMPVPGERGFNFLSVFAWHARKGWDVLLRAFVEEFKPAEDVALILKVWPTFGFTMDDIRHEARCLLRRYGLARELPPHVVFHQACLHAEQLPRLYKAAHAFVLPTRGEGWGRPFMEALLMERPVIATRCSGQLDFLNDENAYLVDCSIADIAQRASQPDHGLRAHRWAEPSRAHLRQLMRLVFEDREGARQKARAGRESIITNFRRETVTERVKRELARIAQLLPRGGGRTRSARMSSLRRISPRGVPVVVWEGSRSVSGSLACVSRELCMELDKAGCAVVLRSGQDSACARMPDDRWQKLGRRAYASMSHPADLYVRHQWLPNLIPPPEGRWVAMQPWEFGSLPKRWLSAFRGEVDEIWVPNQHVLKGYVESGVPRERVAVIPIGVNEREFHPLVQPSDLGRPDEFRFLFVGQTVYSKGIDLLLKAYQEAFKRSDDVCLVIRDLEGDSCYQGQGFRQEILASQRRKCGPPIIYLQGVLPEKEMSGLYRACHVLVHPYRSEAFGLRVLEAMACGVSPIVTNGGACLDFCTEGNSLPVAAEKKYFAGRPLGELETVETPWVYEVSLQDLVQKMRHAYQHPTEVKARGIRASEEARTYWTWRKAAGKALERIGDLRGSPMRRRQLRPARPFQYGRGSGRFRF